MNLVERFADQVKNLVNESTSDVDARAIVRRKPFVITENEKVERIIHLEVDGTVNDFKEGSFKADIRMDSHVVAIVRLKEPICSNEIPFIGDLVSATHADISALFDNTRVKILKVNKESIQLEKSVSIPARASIRLMDLERAKNFAEGKCRCCGEVKKVPLFHGVPGYCRECNEKIIKPLKAEFGGYLQGLLNSGMYFEEDHMPRVWPKRDIDSISRVNGKLIINVGSEEIHAHQDWNTGTFSEILDRQPYGTKAEYDGKIYTIGTKKYRLKVHDWAKGLATKMKELRVDRNLFSVSNNFNGMFIDKDCYGDQTLLHMRRMYNIAKAKWMMDKRIMNEQDALECVEKAELIMNQPDCSRKLHMIISKQLEYAATKLKIALNFETEIAQKIVGIMSAIQVGLENTSKAHENQDH